MPDAFDLAWKLAIVLRGDAATDLLDNSSLERSKVGLMVLRNASRLTDVGTLSNPAAQAVRNLTIRFLVGLRTVRDQIDTTMSEIEIAYANTPLSNGEHPGGERHRRFIVESATGDPRFVVPLATTSVGLCFAVKLGQDRAGGHTSKHMITC